MLTNEIRAALEEILRPTYEAFPGGSRVATRSWSLTSAFTNTRVPVAGDFISATTDGNLAGLSIRFNSQNEDAIYLDRNSEIQYPPGFHEFYLTNDFAQSGRTLWLTVGREYSSRKPGSGPGGAGATQIFQSIRSDKDSHFTGSIVQNAIESEDITGLLGNNIMIRRALILSDQQLSYRLIMWSTDGKDNSDLDLDTFIGTIAFDLPTSGWQIASTGTYYMSLGTIEVPYSDADGTREFHCSLQNLSATAKTAGANGEVVIVLGHQLR